MVAFAACTAILGDDFVINDTLGEGGSVADGGSGGTAGSGTGGTAGAGGDGGTFVVDELACDWIASEFQTLADLNVGGGGGTGPGDRTWSDFVFSTTASEDFLVITNRFDGGQQVMEVYAVGGGGPPTAWTRPSRNVLDVVRIGNSRTGVLNVLPGTGDEVELIIIPDTGADDGTGVSSHLLIPSGVLPGTTNRGKLLHVPGGLEADVAFAVQVELATDYETWFGRFTGSGNPESRRLVAPNINFSEEDYRPTTMVRIGGDTHLWVGEFTAAGQYFSLDDNIVMDPAPLNTLGDQEFVVGMRSNPDDTINIAMVRFTGNGGDFHIGVVAPPDLANIVPTALPLAWQVADIMEAPTRGAWIWQDQDIMLSGRREATKQELKLVVVGSSGHLRVDHTAPLPNAAATLDEIIGVVVGANPIFSQLNGEVELAWTENHTTVPPHHKLQYGKLNCTSINP